MGVNEKPVGKKRGRRPNNFVDKQPGKRIEKTVVIDEPVILIIPVSLSDLTNSFFGENSNSIRIREILKQGNKEIPVKKKEAETNTIETYIGNEVGDNSRQDVSDKSSGPFDIKNNTTFNRLGNKVEATEFSMYSKSTSNSKIKVAPITKTIDDLKNQMESRTNISCWWCCHRFNTFPIRSPTKFDSKRNLFHVTGCFCSFNCCMSYVYKEDNKNVYLVNFLYKKITGKSSSFIKRAPPKEILDIFGGPISIEEYRSSFVLPVTYTTFKFPMIPTPININRDTEQEQIESSISQIKMNSSSNTLISEKKFVDSKRRETTKRLDTIKKNTQKSNSIRSILKIKNCESL